MRSTLRISSDPMKHKLCAQRSLCTRTVAHNTVHQSLHEASYGTVDLVLLDTERDPAICISWIYEPGTVTKIGGVQRRRFVDTPIVFRAEMCELANSGLR
jgi:hypothetical protein